MRLSPGEAAEIILEIIECLPRGTLLSRERRTLDSLVIHFSTRYHIDPLLLRYLVRYPLAPRPTRDVPEGYIDLFPTGGCRGRGRNGDV